MRAGTAVPLIALALSASGCRPSAPKQASVKLPTKYRSEKMFTYEPARERTTSAVSVLTDGGVAAGYECDLIGHHGELTFAKPILWWNGKKSYLPLPKPAKTLPPSGRVWAGNDQVLVGTVLVDYDTKPAAWHPDPKLGWSKPVLQVLSHPEDGPAVIGPSGQVFASWKTAAKQIHGKRLKQPDFSFDFIGFDKSGRIYGNFYHGSLSGGIHYDLEPARFDGSSWQVLGARTPFGGINTVNNSGQAIGSTDTEAVVWTGKKSLVLARAIRPGRAYGTAINDRGLAIVNSSEGCFVWYEGKKLNLTQFVPRLKDPVAQVINNKGQIVVRAELKGGNGNEYYLLNPITEAGK